MKVKLNNGMEMPQFGLGVFMITDNELCRKTVVAALKTGYRLIDTAAVYLNERGVGQGIKDSGVNREEIFLTTKIWVQDYGYEKTRIAIEGALERLQTNYIDLMLLHQPISDYLGSWKALETAVEEGKLKSIGVSNFSVRKLKKILNTAKIKPVVNQVECHPYFQQKQLKEFLNQNNILLEAWYPIGHGDTELLTERIISKMADKYNKSVVQVILRWHMQEGNIAIPKSTNSEHITSNNDIFDFELTNDEISEIRILDKNTGLYKIPRVLQELYYRVYKVKL